MAQAAIGSRRSPGAGRRPSRIFEIVALVVSLTLFFAGMVVCTIGFVVAASRSRRDQLDLGRLALLTGIAPRRVRDSLFGALLVQIVGGLVPAIATKGPSAANTRANSDWVMAQSASETTTGARLAATGNPVGRGGSGSAG